MTLDKDLNLESIRESIFINLLFGDSNEEKINSLDYNRVLIKHRAKMEDYRIRGQYNTIREMTQDYDLWQKKYLKNGVRG